MTIDLTQLTTLKGALISYGKAGFESQFPSVPLVWGNQAFDRNDPPDCYVEAKVVFAKSNALSVGSTKVRHRGSIIFTAVTKRGLGTGTANQAISWLVQTYNLAVIGTTQCEVAQFHGEGESSLGWEIHAIVPLITAPL